MSRITPRRALALAAITTAATAFTASAASALERPSTAGARGTERTAYDIPIKLGGERSGTCFWGTAYTQQTRNIIWPESHTGYPISLDTLPAGGKIVLRGQFPHSRFFSFTVSSPLLQLRHHLYDVEIRPDKGSINPFLPGADRDAKNRSFTITVVDQPDPGPANRKPNVLYAGAAGQEGTPFQVAERVYLPDRGRDFTGGVGNPVPTYVSADGVESTGQAACTALSTKPGAANIPNVNPVLYPASKIQELLALSSSPQHPAVKTAEWYKYFGPAWLLAPYYAGTSQAGEIAKLPLASTGLGANPANGYVFTWLDRSFGPDRNAHNIAVMRGKLPVTPATYAGERRMQGGTQLRYWSACNGEGPTSGKTTGPCLADEEVPIDAQRDYTIVVSLPGDRPKNATKKCGIAWMDWGTTGDGATRPHSTMMVLRNLATTAQPAFRNAVQNVADPAKVKEVMGAYLPTVTYTTAAKFQRSGCNAG